MGRGGKRKGAGRPKGTGKFGEPTKAVRIPISKIEQVLLYVKRQRLLDTPPLVLQGKTGKEILPPPKPPTVFLCSMPDDSMAPTVEKGDLLTVDPTQEPSKGKIVLVFHDGRFFVRTYQPMKSGIKLLSAHREYEPIVADANDIDIYGVVVDRVQKL